MMFGYGNGAGYQMGHGIFLGGFTMIIIFIVLLAVIFLAFGFANKSRNASYLNESVIKTETSLEILKKRFARGEISKEEFDSIKKELLT